MRKPIAVLISDLHFNVNNLEVASAALQAAIDYSNEHKLPLIIAGDLHDTKAIIRGEVANRLLDLFNSLAQEAYILVGNHDLLNEKGSVHGLNYLRRRRSYIHGDYGNDGIYIIDQDNGRYSSLENVVGFIPYCSNNEDIKIYLRMFKDKKLLIMHQGTKGAYLGDYIQDKTSVDPQIFEGFKVFSGHYHKHQTIGPVTYIGSPFTHTFGEANDGPKGFLVLNDDGSYTREILDLRKHVIYEGGMDEIQGWVIGSKLVPNDMLWIKIHGNKSNLTQIDKEALGERLIGHSNFKLDLIPIESEQVEMDTNKLSPSEIFDTLIENEPESEGQKTYLKDLWRKLYETTHIRN